MSGTLRNQKLLWAVLKATVRPVSRNFLHVRRVQSSRTLTIASSTRALSGFSVSFAPEPEEPEPEVPILTEASVKEPNRKSRPDKESKGKRKPPKKAKSKKRSAKNAEAAQVVKPQPEHVNATISGSEGSTDQASTGVIFDNFPTNHQEQEEKTQVERVENNATHVTPVVDSDYDKPVKAGHEDELFVTEGPTTNPWETGDYPSPAFESADQLPNNRPGEYLSAGDKEERKREARRNKTADGIAGRGLDLQRTSFKPQTTIDRVQIASRRSSTTAQTEWPSSYGLHSSRKKFAGRSLVRQATPEGSRSNTKSNVYRQTDPFRPPPTKKDPWQTQKQALEAKFSSEGWNPRKKLSPDTIDGIRALHNQYPDKYTTPILAENFKVSPEAIRRILKSKWRPDPEKQAERRERWARRHDRIWDQQAAIGLRPERTKAKKPTEPGDIDENADIEEFRLARARKQARDTYPTNET